jgi:hypothetical protein
MRCAHPQPFRTPIPWPIHINRSRHAHFDHSPRHAPPIPRRIARPKGFYHRLRDEKSLVCLVPSRLNSNRRKGVTALLAPFVTEVWGRKTKLNAGCGLSRLFPANDRRGLSKGLGITSRSSMGRMRSTACRARVLGRTKAWAWSRHTACAYYDDSTLMRDRPPGRCWKGSAGTGSGCRMRRFDNAASVARRAS